MAHRNIDYVAQADEAIEVAQAAFARAGWRWPTRAERRLWETREAFADCARAIHGLAGVAAAAAREALALGRAIRAVCEEEG